MTWKVTLVITNRSTGSPVPGAPVTAAADGTLLGTTDASGTAQVTLNADSSTTLLDLVPVPPAATGSVFTTWDVAVTITSGGKPVRGVQVWLGNANVITGADGTAVRTFKVFASATQGLALKAASQGGTLFGGNTITISKTATNTWVTVLDGGYDTGINVFTD